MTLICNDCKNIFVDAGPRKHRSIKRCPSCSSGNLIERGVKGTDVDWGLMPHREIRDFNWEDIKSGVMKFYKISTVIVGGGQFAKDKVVLFCPSSTPHTRTELLIVDAPFKPYFFINAGEYESNKIPVTASIKSKGGNIIEKFDGTQSMSHEPVFKVEFPNDGSRNTCFYAVSALGVKVYDNMPLAQRIQMDLGISVGSLPTKLYWDIETDPHNFPTPQKAISRVILICAWDNEGNKFKFILNQEDNVQEAIELKSFFKLAFQYSTCIGFYSDRFDTPYTQARADYLGIAWKWYFINSMDMHAIYTNIQGTDREGEKYDLDTIGFKELGIKKIPKKDIMELYRWYKEDQQALIDYCNRDVEIIHGLDKKFQAIETRLFACDLTCVRPDARVTWINGIESVLMQQGLLETPRTVMHILTSKERKDIPDTYEGAMVRPPDPGMHEWVVVLDFKSMYNRIMQTWNIGLDTMDKDGDIHTPQARFKSSPISLFVKALVRLEQYREMFIIQRDQFTPYSDMWNQYYNKQYILKRYANGIYGMFGSKDSNLYNYDAALSVTLTGQECIKAAIRESEKLNNKVIYADTDSVFLIVPEDKRNLEDVLAWSKDLLSKISDGIGQHMKDEFGVVTPKIDIEIDKVFTKLMFTPAAKKYVGWLLWRGSITNPSFMCKKCSKTSLASEILEIPEKEYQRQISKVTNIEDITFSIMQHGAICPKCSGAIDTNPKLYVYISGFETKRGDWTKYARDLQRKLFDMKLEELPEQEQLDWVKTYVVALYQGACDKDIVFTKAVRQRLDDYKANPQHVKAAKMWEKRTGQKVRVGQYMSYYVINGAGEVYPIIEHGESVEVSRGAYDYVFDHQIYGILERLGFKEHEIESVRYGGQSQLSTWS